MKTIEKIRAEIERMKRNAESAKKEWNDGNYNQNAFAEDCRISSFDHLLAFLDTLSEEEPVPKGYDEAYLNEKIAKASKTWEGVDVDKYMDEVRGREPSKGLDVTDFCKPVDPGIAQCVADHWWEMMDEEPDKSLEEEVKRYYSDNFAYISSDQPTLSILTNIARHFAQWGAKHLKK